MREDHIQVQGWAENAVYRRCGGRRFPLCPTYIAKAFIEDRFVLGLPLEAVMLTVTQKSIISSMNAVIAVIVAVPLGLALRPTAGKFLPDRHGLY